MGSLSFQSDVDGGPALTPFTGGTGIDLANFFEDGGGALNGTLGRDSGNPLTLVGEGTEVPEPAALLLLASCIVPYLVRYRWYQRA